MEETNNPVEWTANEDPLSNNDRDSDVITCEQQNDFTTSYSGERLINSQTASRDVKEAMSNALIREQLAIVQAEAELEELKVGPANNSKDKEKQKRTKSFKHGKHATASKLNVEVKVIDIT